MSTAPVDRPFDGATLAQHHARVPWPGYEDTAPVVSAGATLPPAVAGPTDPDLAAALHASLPSNTAAGANAAGQGGRRMNDVLDGWETTGRACFADDRAMAARLTAGPGVPAGAGAGAVEKVFGMVRVHDKAGSLSMLFHVTVPDMFAAKRVITVDDVQVRAAGSACWVHQ